MNEAGLFQYLVRLPEPWTVQRVAVNPAERRIDIWAGHQAGVIWPCPECVRTGACRDHAAERVWRHLDCCRFEVYLRARIPRVACPKHGVRQILIPWADPDSHFTRFFERFTVELLETCSVSGTAAVLDLTWDEARGIQQRAVKRQADGNKARSRDQGLTAQKIKCVHDDWKPVRAPHPDGGISPGTKTLRRVR